MALAREILRAGGGCQLGGHSDAHAALYADITLSRISQDVCRGEGGDSHRGWACGYYVSD